MNVFSRKPTRGRNSTISLLVFAYFVSIALLILVTPASVNSAPVISGQPPYPSSSVIDRIEWDMGNLVRLAPGSDLWPVTWGPDGSIYTSWGDGGGFGGTNSDGRVSLGFAKISGSPDNLATTNIWGGKNKENPSQFTGKTAGIISVEGVLYTWINTQNRSNGPDYRLAWSTDLGAHWQQSSWIMNSRSFALATFLNFGKDNAGARDNFVYSYGGKWGNSADVFLARVPKDSITNLNAYEYLSGFDGSGSPAWSSNASNRKAIFSDSGSTAFNPSLLAPVVYNSGLGRYILTTPHGDAGQWGVFDAHEPWGPWTTVEYYENWGGFSSFSNEALAYGFSTKWTSSDGLESWMTFSGTGGALDSFNLVKGTFAISSSDNENPPEIEDVSEGSDVVSQSLVSDVNAASGEPYEVVQDVEIGDAVYIDRSYEFTNMPLRVNGSTLIRTANDDKSISLNDFLSFRIDRKSRVYVAYDARAISLPTWLLGWADHNEVLRTSDADRDLYSKEFNAGEVAIGGNLAGGAVGVDSNYSVFIVGVEGPSDGQENELPVASFNATPNSGEAPLTVNFDASESTDPDGSIASYDWAFGDGKSGTGKTINHEFDEPGTYDVMLTVTDDVGGSDTAQDTIEVEEPQEKGLTADPPGFCRGLPATLSGTQGDDIIEGTPSRDVIIGMAGNDTIRGHQGNDIICGGDGDDEIFGNGDNDILEGGGGNDRISGGYGRDIVHGGDGDDWVAGGWGVEDGPDIVSGGRGHDFVFGGEGDDVLWGGAGRDHLYGGPGNDTLHGNGSWDRLRGGSGNDSLYGNGARDFLFGEEGDDDLYGGEGTDACHGGSGINSFVNCE